MSKNIENLFPTYNIDKISKNNSQKDIFIKKSNTKESTIMNLFTNNSKRNKFLTLLMEFLGSFLFVFLLLLPNIMYFSIVDINGETTRTFFGVLNNFLPLLALYNTFIIWLIFINGRIHLDLRITSGGAISLHRKGNLDNKKAHQVLETIVFQLLGAFLASYFGYLIIHANNGWNESSTLGAIQSQMNGFIFANNGAQNFGIVFWFLPLQITINLINILTVNHSQKEMQAFTNKTNTINNFKYLGIIYLISFIALEFNAQPISPNGVISNGIISFAFGGANNLFTMFAIVFAQYTLAICLLNNQAIRGNLN